MIGRLLYGVSAIWVGFAAVAFVSARPLTGVVVALTAAAVAGAGWALTPCDCDTEPLPALRWPGPLRMVCAVCGEQWSAVDPDVDVWCDAAEVHWRSHGALAPHALDAYRAAVTMHAELAADTAAALADLDPDDE